MLCEDKFEIVGEGSRVFGIALGNVGDQIDRVMEGFNRVGCSRCGRSEENLSLRLILLPLLKKLLFVRPNQLDSPSNKVLEKALIAYFGSRRILYCRLALGNR